MTIPADPHDPPPAVPPTPPAPPASTAWQSLGLLAAAFTLAILGHVSVTAGAAALGLTCYASTMVLFAVVVRRVAAQPPADTRPRAPWSGLRWPTPPPADWVGPASAAPSAPSVPSAPSAPASAPRAPRPSLHLPTPPPPDWVSPAAAAPAKPAARVPVPRAPVRLRLTPRLLAVGLGGLGVLATLAATGRVDVPGGLTAAQDRATVVIWLFGIAAFAASVLALAGWRPPTPRALAAGVRAHARELSLVALLAAGALAVRVVQLTAHPYPMLKDEGYVGLESVQVLTGQLTNLFHGGWSQQPTWASLPTALAVAVFGPTLFALRSVSALLGMLNVVLLYALARLWFNRPTALMAAGFLLALPMHVHFSRLGVTNLVVPVCATLIFWLTYRALQRDRLADYLWAGLVVGASLYSYLGTRLVVALAGLTLAYYGLVTRGYLRTHWRHLAVYGGSALVVALPVLTYFSRYPEKAMSAYNAYGILPTGWLAAQLAQGRSLVEVLGSQVARSTLVFFNEPAWEGFYNSPHPYFTPVAAGLLALGLGLTVWRWRAPQSVSLLSWFWGIVLAGSALTLSPPTSERLVGALPAAALLAALGLAQAAAWARLGLARLWPRWPRLQPLTPALVTLACVLVVSLTAAFDVAYYFGAYQTNRYFQHQNEELEAAIISEVQASAAPPRLYLLTDPTARASVFPQARYLLPTLEMQDLTDVSAAALSALPHDQALLFVAIPDRQPELEQIAAALPGGTLTVVPRRPIPGRALPPLYLTYRLAPWP